MDHEVSLLRLQFLHLLAQDLIDTSEVVPIVFKAQLKELQRRHFKEPRVVFALNDRVVHIGTIESA